MNKELSFKIKLITIKLIKLIVNKAELAAGAGETTSITPVQGMCVVAQLLCRLKLNKFN